MSAVITIDGPAGSGKSTAARKLAAKLELAYLDTGAMYRAVTFAALQRKISLADADAIRALLDRTDLRMDCGPTHARVSLDGHDVTEAIRQPDVTGQTSQLAQLPTVRERLIGMQREIAARLGRLVTEGRDQGTTVFPHAICKFLLTATLEKRAERRFHEMAADGIDEPFQWVLENLRFRDNNDSHRWAKLLSDPAARVIDTTNLGMTEVVDRMAEIVRPLLAHAVEAQRGLFDE